MATVVTSPTWTDGATLLAITTVALNAVSRTTFSLNGKIGAMVYIWLGRGGAIIMTTPSRRSWRTVHWSTDASPVAPSSR